jgi:hypothetical protein
MGHEKLNREIKSTQKFQLESLRGKGTLGDLGIEKMFKKT